MTTEQIEEILMKCNVNKYHKIYISCECGVDKKSSKLFEYVQRKENIAKNKWLHIGDGLKSDLVGSLKAGIFPMWIPK